MTWRRYSIAAAAACAVAGLLGCAGRGPGQAETSARQPVTATKVPDRILCVWQPAEHTAPDGSKASGLAGQILFFGENGSAAVAADGDVAVDIFRAGDELKADAAPLRRFDFPAEAWQRCQRTSVLGPAYFVFIPIDAAGAEGCAIRVQNVMKDGSVLHSEPAPILARANQLAAEASPHQIAERVAPISRTEMVDKEKIAKGAVLVEPRRLAPDLAQVGIADRELFVGDSHCTSDAPLVVHPAATALCCESVPSDELPSAMAPASDTGGDSGRGHVVPVSHEIESQAIPGSEQAINGSTSDGATFPESGRLPIVEPRDGRPSQNIIMWALPAPLEDWYPIPGDGPLEAPIPPER